MAKAKKKKKKAKKSDIMGAFTDAAEKALGPGALYTPSSEKTRHIGVPLPSLSFEFLLGSNVLWLGSSYGLAGPTQSFKSSLAMDLMRSVLQMGGYGSTVETEGGKISEIMIQSLLGELRERHKLTSRSTVEEAQDALTFVVSWFKKTFPKRDVLFSLMLDSLFGPPGAEKRKAILKQGHASRAYPIEALLWSAWLQTFAPGLTGYPIIFMFVNHLKKDTDGGNWRHPGGDAQDFYSTVYFHVMRIRAYDGTDTAITQVQIKTVKHSFYLPGRKIYVPYVFDKINNKLFFDWGHSTADLLSSDLVPSTVKDVLDISSTAKNMTALSRTFSCKQMGMKEVSGTELGDAIHADADLMRQLREAARINMYDVWDGIMPVPKDVPKDSEEPAEIEESDEEDVLEI